MLFCHTNGFIVAQKGPKLSKAIETTSKTNIVLKISTSMFGGQKAEFDRIGI
jgi:hypothetical protein